MLQTEDRPDTTVVTETLQRAAHNVGDTVWALPSDITEEKDKDYKKLQKRTVKRVNVVEATYVLSGDADEVYDNERTYGNLHNYNRANPYQHGHRAEVFEDGSVRRATLVCWHKGVVDHHGFEVFGAGFADDDSLLLEVDPDRSTMLHDGPSLVAVDPYDDYDNIYSVVPTPDGRNEVRAAFRW